MNGKAEFVERVLESVRQRHLTKALGQVVCPHTHGSWINPDQCPGCGAAV